MLRGMLFTGDEPIYMRSGVPDVDPDVPGAWYPPVVAADEGRRAAI